MRRVSVITFVFLLSGCSQAFATSRSSNGRIAVVAAENFYGDVVRQLGGNRVQVYTVIQSPAADPHEYEPTARDAVHVAVARIVIMNGVGYDSWMDRLLSGSSRSGRAVLSVGSIAHVSSGSNPHLWYDLSTMLRLAVSVTRTLETIDPRHSAFYELHLKRFKMSFRPIQARITSIRSRYGGVAVAETEPVFRYMLSALHLHVPASDFQKAVEDGTSPPAGQIVAFENLLRSRTTRCLIYNTQAVQPVTETMAAIARANRVPVVGVSETEPRGLTYQVWMQHELQAVEVGLAQ